MEGRRISGLTESVVTINGSRPVVPRTSFSQPASVLNLLSSLVP